MASRSGSISIGSASSVSSDLKNNIFWKYVTKIVKTGGGGNCKWICNFCEKEHQGTHTRVRAHLLRIPGKGIGQCPKVKPSDILEMDRLEEEVRQRIENEKLNEVPLPSDCSNDKKRKMNSPVGQLFDNQHKAQLDCEIARMFYTGGLPFTLAKNPYYLSAFKLAASSRSLAGWVPPGYNKLRTTLLDQERVNVERLLEPLKATWKDSGVTICSDGWSDPQRRPLINFMATSGSGPMFLSTVNCQGEVKDKFFIANLMKQVIDEVGHENVVQVITDNAANCKGAGEIIEGMYPNIYWTPCVVHTLNLALKNICAARNVESNSETFDECHWITEIHGDAVQIKNFIMNHSIRLAIFNKFSSLKLLAVADTRFASVTVMLKRIKLLRRSLETMVISEEWGSYREDDQGKARFVKEKVLDEFWWDQVDYILEFTGPIYDMIRACDTDKPGLHLVYEQWDCMIEKVKLAIYKHEHRQLDDDSPFYKVVHTILIYRWAKSNNPLHCLAHSLNPKYYSDEWLHEDPSRVPPNKDDEISEERMKCFRRLFPDESRFNKVMFEYSEFSRVRGKFRNHESLTRRSTMEANVWWDNFGACTSLLQTLAFKVLGQPTSSSCCERNWSTYSFIHSLRRNKLSPKRAEDLVFIHNNLRCLSRNGPQYKDEMTKFWDIGGDAFGNMEDTGVLEFAELSLDEPELEMEFLASGNERVENDVIDV